MTKCIERLRWTLSFPRTRRRPNAPKLGYHVVRRQYTVVCALVHSPASSFRAAMRSMRTLPLTNQTACCAWRLRQMSPQSERCTSLRSILELFGA